MNGAQYYSLLVFLAGVLVWQLVSGTALGAWWRPRITRRDDPWVYWFFVAAQCVIWIIVLTTGRIRHVR
jgi:hypothetical protein